jgi:hypothetical protein
MAKDKATLAKDLENFPKPATPYERAYVPYVVELPKPPKSYEQKFRAAATSEKRSSRFFAPNTKPVDMYLAPNTQPVDIYKPQPQPLSSAPVLIYTPQSAPTSAPTRTPYSPPANEPFSPLSSNEGPLSPEGSEKALLSSVITSPPRALSFLPSSTERHGGSLFSNRFSKRFSRSRAPKDLPAVLAAQPPPQPAAKLPTYVPQAARRVESPPRDTRRAQSPPREKVAQIATVIAAPPAPFNEVVPVKRGLTDAQLLIKANFERAKDGKMFVEQKERERGNTGQREQSPQSRSAQREQSPQPRSTPREQSPQPRGVPMQREQSPQPRSTQNHNDQSPQPRSVAMQRERSPSPLVIPNQREQSPHPTTLPTQRNWQPQTPYPSTQNDVETQSYPAMPNQREMERSPHHNIVTNQQREQSPRPQKQREQSPHSQNQRERERAPQPQRNWEPEQVPPSPESQMVPIHRGWEPQPPSIPTQRERSPQSLQREQPPPQQQIQPLQITNQRGRSPHHGHQRNMSSKSGPIVTELTTPWL